MAFGITSEDRLGDAVALDDAGSQQIKAAVERTHWTVGVAADEQDAVDARLGRRALHEIPRLSKARKPARGDVRHRDEAGATQLGAGGDDVVMRHARRVVDEYSHTRIDQLAQSAPGQIVMRLDFDRTSGDQLRLSAAMRIVIECALRLSDRDTHQPESRLREIT